MFSKFLFIIFYINFLIIRETNSNPPLLLVLMYDGFRNEYLDRGVTPTLSNFRANGVHSDYMKTVYPALGISAMNSISTGYYPQVHGYNMRDEQLDKHKYNYKYIKEKKEQFKIIPIWELNQQNGGKTVCSMWEGSYYYSKIQCTNNIAYELETTLKARFDDVIKLLNVTADVRPNLVLFYVEQLDRIGHFFGPLSRNTTVIIRRLDLLTKYIIKKLIDLKIYHNTNIMILSDHGMRAVTKKDELEKEERTIKLDTLAMDDINAHVVFESPDQASAPVDYKATINDFAKKAEYDKKVTIVSIPPGANEPIIIDYAACPGYALDLTNWQIAKYSVYEKVYKNLSPPKSKDGPFGVHGYLRENDAIFMAKGPMFAMFKKVEPFEMVDLYSAFTLLLNIKGEYERDGNFSRVFPIFRTHKPMNWIPILVTIFLLAFITTIILFFFVEYLVRP